MKTSYQIIRKPVITEKGLAIKENQNTLVFQVDLGPGRTSGLEYRECVSYYMFRHQQIPGLLYGYDPMPESADPIESRQTRIVGCDNP